MSVKEYNKLRRLVKIALQELEKEATKTGEILSSNYDNAVEIVKQKVVEGQGFVYQEYLDRDKEVSGMSQAKVVASFEKIKADQVQNTQDLVSSLNELNAKIALVDSKVPTYANLPDKPIIPTTGQIERQIKQATKDLALKSQIKPPKETIKEIVVDNSKVEELGKDVVELQKAVSEWHPPVVDLEPIKADIKDSADKIGQMEQNLRDMPDFRKLGMGLQGQIDERIIGTSDNLTVPKLTVSLTAPSKPKKYDLWVDIN